MPMRIVLTGSALTMLAVTPAFAQLHPQVRDGFTISVGGGAGSAGFSCDECSSKRKYAPSAYLRIGGAARPNLVLAGEVNVWTKNETEDEIEATTTVGMLSAVAQWYPQTSSGFFLSAGAGAGGVMVDAKLPDGVQASERTKAIGYQLGTGYDVRVRKNFSITPYATYYAVARGKLADEAFKIGSNVVHFGVGLTWH